jgi:tRNA (guanine-N7-)-methyltransferase
MKYNTVRNADQILNNSKYLIKNPRNSKNNWSSVFGNNNNIDLELGMGRGAFIIEMAKKYPNINFIGLELDKNQTAYALDRLSRENISNLRVICDDAKNIGEIFGKEIDTIYLNFSDPWPKDRHAKRRLTSPVFLNIYDNIFKNTKKIIMKTDNLNLFNYSLETLTQYGYQITYKTNDLNSLDEDNIMTEYETKFYNKGIKINKLVAIKK